MVSDREPGIFFRLTPQTHPEIKIPTPSDPTGNIYKNVESKK